MKNIHLLSASKQEYQVKEGGLFINDTRKHYWGKLEVLRCERVTQHGHAWNGTGIRTDICHLYLTSDEEIKEGDWCIVGNVVSKLNTQFTSKEEINTNWKKIILTTDQSLEGVQEIDDEFLQWIVQNQSCDVVEVQKLLLCTYCGGEHCDNLACRGWEDKPYYEVIIPQEEPKQERMYSEEEVINLLQEMNDWPTICEGRSDIEEWFKQFKKKQR